VRMWKPSSVAEAVENACYAEEHMNLTGGTRPTFPRGRGLSGEGAHHRHMVTESRQGQ
jgi:hypothetical protein